MLDAESELNPIISLSGIKSSWSFRKSSAHWSPGWLVIEAPAQALGPSCVWEKKKAVSLRDTLLMSDGAGGAGRVGGEEMVERGSSSRKRGRGVKWRQVFHDKPYNPPLLLSSFF